MKKILFIFLLVAIGLGVWFWQTHHGEPADAAAEPVATASVETTPLVEREIAQTLETFGVIGASPSGEHVAAATFDGIVSRVAVRLGSRVAVGDVLLELAPSPDAQLALASARSGASLAEKTLTDTQRRFDLNLATQPELQAAQQAADEAKLKAASLEARGAGGDGRMRATVAGVVSKLDATAGAWVNAGAALATVIDEEALEVRLGLEAADVARVAPGQTVKFESVNRPDAGEVSSKVREVGRIVDPATGAMEANAAVPPGASWLPGEHVRATIELTRKTALVAPRRALLPKEGHQVLFTVKDGKAIRHEVQVGVAAGDFVEVGGVGLRAGDAVVTRGNYELEDGMAVQPGAAVVPAPKNAGVERP